MAWGASASAGVIYSVSGTVGDPSWSFDGAYYTFSTFFSPPLIPWIFEPPFNIFNANSIQTQPSLTYEVQFTTTAPVLFTFDDVLVYEWDNLYACSDYPVCANPTYTPIGDDDLPGVFENLSPTISGDTQTLYVTDYQTVTRQLMPDFPVVGDSVNIHIDGVNGFGTQDTLGASAFGAPFSFTLSIVPEPATWTFMLTGVAMMGAALRSRRRPGPVFPL